MDRLINGKNTIIFNRTKNLDNSDSDNDTLSVNNRAENLDNSEADIDLDNDNDTMSNSYI